MKTALLLTLTLCAVVAHHSLASSQPDAKPSHRAAYSKNLRIHVGQLGVSDGKPLTKGDDLKPV